MRFFPGGGRVKPKLKLKLFSTAELEAAYEEIIEGADAAPFGELLESLDPGRVLEALGSIPEEFAEAVKLHDVQGLSYREIARITEVPAGTVTSRISRGRRLLAGLLAIFREDAERGAA